ncbi:MAG TPA: Fic family protein [Methylomirabilota bacterium]|nr:Fic family protein [Methylomirabilota bacterium]
MDILLTQLTEKKKKLYSYKPLALAFEKNIEEWLKVELTYSSNAIEGNTLTRIETAEVIEKGIGAIISGKSLKDQLEAINHAKAIELIKKLAVDRKGHQFITEKDILDIHKIILTGINDPWAGRYRNTEVFIRGSNAEFPIPQALPHAMKEFINWLQAQQGEHPVKVAADAHYKFVSIHPFIDGNGRTTRLLMNLILLLNGYPMAIIRNEERTVYLQSFATAQNKDDMQPFYSLIFAAVNRSLDMYLDALQKKRAVLKNFTSEPQENLLKIGEVAKATNEAVPTIRYWTKEGLLKVTDYSEGGYQLYAPAVIDTVKKIRELQKEKRLTIVELKKALS